MDVLISGRRVVETAYFGLSTCLHCSSSFFNSLAWKRGGQRERGNVDTRRILNHSIDSPILWTRLLALTLSLDHSFGGQLGGFPDIAGHWRWRTGRAGWRVPPRHRVGSDVINDDVMSSVCWWSDVIKQEKESDIILLIGPEAMILNRKWNHYF